MKDAHLLQKYERCKELAEELNLSFYVNEDSIRIEKDSKEALGVLYTVDELFTYLCGYHEGYLKGKLIK